MSNNSRSCADGRKRVSDLARFERDDPNLAQFYTNNLPVKQWKRGPDPRTGYVATGPGYGTAWRWDHPRARPFRVQQYALTSRIQNFRVNLLFSSGKIIGLAEGGYKLQGCLFFLLLLSRDVKTGSLLSSILCRRSVKY